MKKEFIPSDSERIRQAIKFYMFGQVDFKTPLEICRAIGEPESRVGTVMSRYRDLVCMGYVPYYDKIEVNGKKIQTYKLGKPLFTNGELFEEYRQHDEDYTHPDNR